MLPAELVQCGVFAIGIVFFTDAVQLESVLLVKGSSLGIAVADFQKALVAIFVYLNPLSRANCRCLCAVLMRVWRCSAVRNLGRANGKSHSLKVCRHPRRRRSTHNWLGSQTQIAFRSNPETQVPVVIRELVANRFRSSRAVSLLQSQDFTGSFVASLLRMTLSSYSQHSFAYGLLPTTPSASRSKRAGCSSLLE